MPQRPVKPRALRRVLMTADAVGGVWSYALDLAQGLAELGVQTTLAGLGPLPSARQRRDAAAVEGLDLVWSDIPLAWMADGDAALAEAGPYFVRLANMVGADVMHLNAAADAADLPAAHPVVVTSHSCLATWWQAVEGTPPPEDWQWAIRRDRAGLARADRLVAPSRSHAAATAAVHGVTASGLTVVPNGRRWPDDPPVEKQSFVVAAARWWDRGKNLALLDAAAAGLPCPVVLAGSSRGPVSDAPATRNVHMLGRRPADVVRRLMREAAVVASPSLYEPFGLAALEGAQAGCALVLSDIPTYRELWDGAALFAPPRDDEAWRKALATVIADSDLRRDLAEKAQARARAFTPSRQAEAMVAVYAQAAAAPSRTAA